MAKNKCPMTKEEFTKRVTELFIEKYGEDEEKAKDFINNLIENDDYFDMLYADSCYRHDAFGGDAFTDEELISQPVRLLHKIY